MGFVKRFTQSLCKKRGIDYHLAQKAFHMLADDAKNFFRTIDTFLYDRIYRPYTLKTITEDSGHCITTEYPKIRGQWAQVKKDWRIFRQIVKNAYASEEQDNKKGRSASIDDYMDNRDRTDVSGTGIYRILNIRPDGKTERPFTQKKETTDDTIPAYEFSPAYASQVITAAQRYRGKNLQKTQSYLEKKMQLREDLESTVMKAMSYRVQHPQIPKDFPAIRFRRELLSEDMRQYITTAYINSPASIRELSESFENRYGMHISVTTFSKYARALIASTTDYEVSVRSRREARASIARYVAATAHYCRQEQTSTTMAAA